MRMVIARSFIFRPTRASSTGRYPPLSAPWISRFSHQRLAGVGTDQLEAEVSGSRASIGELLGAPVRGFAYPYGSMDAAARRAVGDAGYDYACATEPPMAELGIMALPRIGVGQRDGPVRLAAKRHLFTSHIAVKGDILKVPRPRGSRSTMAEDQAQSQADLRAVPAIAGGSSLDRVPMILMYHNIAEIAEDPMGLCVAPARFAEQMSWLKTQGLRGVGIGILIEAMRAGRQRGMVGITFDDGYFSVLETAVPELLRHRFTATMFIISGRLGGTNEWCVGPAQPLMSAEQVGELAAAGMEVGSHAATHVRLAGISRDQLEAEVSGSRASIGELLGAPVRGFAYPYGSMDAAARRAVGDAGYDYACATEPPMAELGIMALPRIGVGQRDGPVRLAAKRLIFTGGPRRFAAKRLAFKGYTAVKGRFA